MNDSYLISKGDTFQLAGDLDQFEDGYTLTEFNDSLQLHLEDPGGSKRIERRCHQRYRLRADTFAVIRSLSEEPLIIRGKSMGCIACAVFNAKPARLGKIENISLGGLMFQHIAGKKRLSGTFVLDILQADSRFFLANVPFEIRSDILLKDDETGNPFDMRRVRLQFRHLSADQEAKLKGFLLNYGK